MASSAAKAAAAAAEGMGGIAALGGAAAYLAAANGGGTTYKCGNNGNNTVIGIGQACLSSIGLGSVWNPYDPNSSNELSKIKNKIQSISNSISQMTADTEIKLDQTVNTTIKDLTLFLDETNTMNNKYVSMNLKEQRMYVVTITSSVLIIAIFFIFTK